MAGETLLTLAEVLASLPDNNSNLIQPLDHRNEAIALTNDVGFVEEDDAFVIPIIDGTFVSINPLMPTPTTVGNFWITDGNNALIPSFGTITINPGHQRLLDLTCHIEAAKQGGASTSYTFQFFVGASPAGREINIDLDPSTEALTLSEEVLYDYSVADPVTIRVRGDGTGDDLDVADMDMKVVGILI